MKLLLDTPKLNPLFQIEHTHRLFFLGSCFAENMTSYFNQRKFITHENPFGILYNPISITNCLRDIVQRKAYDLSGFYSNNGLVSSWHHHSKCSATSATELKERLDKINQQSHEDIKRSDVAFITLGTAWTFFHKELACVVANNHKAPAELFEKKLLDISEIQTALQEMVSLLRELNSDIKIVWTLSPVRHSKQGLAENNLSKARLLESIHSICQQDAMSLYFPSYEIILDVLRDYRFYKQDLVHPNHMATDYIWDYMEDTIISPIAKDIMHQCLSITRAMQHKVLHPNTSEAKQFIATQLNRIEELQATHPYIDLKTEQDYFKSL